MRVIWLRKAHVFEAYMQWHIANLCYVAHNGGNGVGAYVGCGNDDGVGLSIHTVLVEGLALVLVIASIVG